LKAIEEQLIFDRFTRIHRSNIVYLANISLIERYRIAYEGKVYIPQANSRREDFKSIWK
jgi:DNA-binding LytR/AlgR family response regulator